MISRAVASEIALAAFRERGYDCVSAPAHRFDELWGGNVYGVSAEDLMNGWFAYLVEAKPILMLHSSTIAVIAGDTGNVLYLGSACDEG